MFYFLSDKIPDDYGLVLVGRSQVLPIRRKTSTLKSLKIRLFQRSEMFAAGRVPKMCITPPQGDRGDFFPVRAKDSVSRLQFVTT